MTAIPFFQHDLGDQELAEIARVLKGNILTTGEQVAEFEQQFAAFLGVKHVIGLTSCTGALHLSLAAHDIGQGDEVITTALSFIATATAIIQAGATPIFVDAEAQTGNIDISKIEQAITAKTKAIIPVHLYGQMVDMPALKAIADKFHLKIIEDSAHCIEGSRHGVRPGHLGDTACFSFYATKNITCGEGGAVATNDDNIAKKLKLLRSHGMEKTAHDRDREGYSHWDMPIFGWKYNMDNIQAAMLLPQLSRINDNRHKRALLVNEYKRGLADLENISTFQEHPDVIHAYHLMPIKVPAYARDKIISEFNHQGIGVVVNYRPIHQFAYFKSRQNQEGLFPVAEDIGTRVISLPLYPAMPLQHVETVLKVLHQIMGQL